MEKSKSKLMKQVELQLLMKKLSIKPAMPASAADLLQSLQAHQNELEIQKQQLQLLQARLEQQNQLLLITHSELSCKLERYIKLYDFSPAANLTLDVNGRILQANYATARLFNQDRSELYQLHFSELIREDLRLAFSTFLEKLFHYNHQQSSELVLEIAGRSIFVAVEASPNLEQQVCDFVIFEITKQKQVVQALINNETRLKLGISVAGIALAEVNYTSGLIYLSAEAAKLFGLGERAVVLPREAVHAFFHPDDREELTGKITEFLSPSGSGWLDTSHRVIWSDGSVHWLHVRKQAFYKNDGSVKRPVNAIIAMQNITSARNAQEAVLTSEAFARSVLDSLPEQVAVLDNNGNVICVNETWARYAIENCGSSVVSEGVNYLDVCRRSAVSGDQSAEQALRGLEAVLARECQEFVIEYFCPAPNRELCLLMHCRRVSLNSENIIVSHIDITERKQIEKTLKESEEFNRSILNNSADCIEVIDLDGNLILMNGPGQAMMEIDDFSQYVNKSWVCFWLGSSKMQVNEVLQTARQGGIGRFQGYCKTAKGKLKWLDAAVTVILDSAGQPKHYVAISRDITERKHIDEKLRESEEAFRLMFESSSVGKIETDPFSGRFIRVNAAFCQLTGYSEAELLKCTFQDITHPEDRVVDVELKDKFVSGELPIFEREKRYMQPNGKQVWAQVTLNLIRDVAGRPLRLIGVVLDISDRKRVEEALLEADRRKNEFLAMLGHELRNPLTPISMVAQIMNTDSLDEHRLNWIREILNRNVTQMSRLVDDLLDVSCITHGVVEIRREPVELVQLLKDSAESIHSLTTIKQQRLNLELPGHQIYISGDSVRLTQVFINLLTNASKYTGEEGQIDLKLCIVGSSIIVSVQDSGMGIEPLLLPHIFDLFTQGKRGLDRSEGGLGIGLTLARKLVELHDGLIMAFSPGVNQGSKFLVQLPKPEIDISL